MAVSLVSDKCRSCRVSPSNACKSTGWRWFCRRFQNLGIEAFEVHSFGAGGPRSCRFSCSGRGLTSALYDVDLFEIRVHVIRRRGIYPACCFMAWCSYGIYHHSTLVEPPCNRTTPLPQSPCSSSGFRVPRCLLLHMIDGPT